MGSRSRLIGSGSRIFSCFKASLASLVVFLPISVIAAMPAGPSANITVKVEAPGQALIVGSATQFVVRVHNSGAGGSSEDRLSVPIPQGLQNLSWTCSAMSGSRCSSVSGSGALNEPLQGLGSNSTLEYVFRADVDKSAPAFVEVSANANLAGTARCASAETPPCRSSLSLATGPGIMLDIRSSSAARSPGQQVSYTISAHAVSTLSDSSGTVLRSPVPNGLINSSWRCRSNVGACAQASGQGSINQVLGNFSKGSVRFDVSATVAANAPANIVQSAVAVAPYGGSCAIAENGAMRFQSSACTARNVLATAPSILLSQNEDYRADATSIATRFVLDNNGAAADGSIVNATLAEGVSRLDWTCVGEGATCPQASGSGAIHQTINAWPTYGRLTYDLISRVESSATSKATNVLQVKPSARGVCAAGGSSDVCTAVYSMTPAHAGLKLSQSVNSLGANSRDVVTYRINVGNAASAATARNVVLHVPLPEGIQRFEQWTCSAGRASATACPKASGTGAIREMFAQLAPASDLDYVIRARVGSNPPATVSSRASLTAPASAELGCGITDARSHACVASTQFSTVPVLALDQSMSATTLAPGSMVEYFYDVFNFGAKADLVQVRNFLPRGVSNVSWACSGLGMGCPVASGNGNITSKLNQMPSGTGVRYHVTAQVDNTQPEIATSVLAAKPDQRGRCHNPATGSSDSASCVDRVSNSYAPKLELTQASDEQQLLRGGVIHHSLTLKNIGGPTSATRLALPMAAGIERSNWNCSGFGGAVCPQASGSGAIDARIASLPFDAYLQYSIRSVLANNAPSTISTVATTSPGAKASCADLGCANTLSLPVTDVPSANLQVIVAAAANVAHPGAATSWTVDVRNVGSENSGLFSVRNLMAGSGVTINNWTCSGAKCPAAAGNGALDLAIASLPVYAPASSNKTVAIGQLHFIVNGTIAQNPANGAEFAVQIQPAEGDTCAPVACVASSTLPSGLLGQAEVTLEVFSEEYEVYPNSVFTYTYTIRNTGPAELQNLPVYTTNPVGIVSSSWTCLIYNEVSCGSGSGEINEVLPSLPSGEQVVFTITANTDSSIPSELEFVVGANPGEGTLCNPQDCMDMLYLYNGLENLNLSLDADVEFVEPNSTITYTFEIYNSGGDTYGVNILGLDSPSFTSSSWTCETNAKAGCTPSGNGPLGDGFSFFGSGESATYTITATVGATPPASIDYRVQITPDTGRGAPTGGFNCVPASCDVSVSLPVASPTLALSMNFNPDGMGSGSFTYTISNPGPADVSDVEIYGVDAADFVSSSWTCAGTGTFCTPSGIGELEDYIEYFPANASVTYTVTPEFDQPLPTTANYSAGVNMDPQNPHFICIPDDCVVSVSASLTAPSPPRLSITKTADVDVLTPGGNVGYTVKITNTGNVDANAILFEDAIPSGLISFDWTCSSSSNAFCEQGSGSGALNLFIEYLPAGGSLTYRVDAVVSSTATGSVVNLARLTGEAIQCVPFDCQAVSSLAVEPPAQITVSKSVTPPAGSTISPGEPISWTLSALNSGGATTTALSLRDVLPATISDISVVSAQGVRCNMLSPEPGSTLTCSIDPGFSGQASVTISAIVAAEATGALVNSVSATGISNITCDNCSVSNPVGQAIDLALVNPRPFSAGGVAGTLIDVVNLSPTSSSMSQLSVSPASSLFLLAPYASACTTTIDAEGNVSVSCPTPPQSQGIQCSGASCSLGQLSQDGALTVFVALTGSSPATVQIIARGDADSSNNSIELSAGGTP